MIKLCEWCGKPFEARNTNYKLCSDGCRKAKWKQYRIDYRADEDNHARASESRRRSYKRRFVDCPICGDTVTEKYKRVHEDCVINEGIAAYMRNPTKFSRMPEYKKCHNQGITKRDLMEIIEDRKHEKRTKMDF